MSNGKGMEKKWVVSVVYEEKLMLWKINQANKCREGCIQMHSYLQSLTGCSTTQMLP